MTARDTTLEFRPIATAVGRTARRYAGRILVVAVAVSAVTVAAELTADHLLDQVSVTTALAGSLSASTVSLLGAVFLSGFLCRLVSDTEHGDPGHGDPGHGDPGHGDPGHGGRGHGGRGHGGRGTRIRDVLRSLPWGSLVLADVLATLVIVAGLVALIVPGLVAITLLAVVGPVIEIEHRSALAGLRRCVRLVRPHFWRVAAFATLPLLLTNGIVAFLPDPAGTADVLTTLVVRSAGEGILESAVGLLLVELCYRLIAADRAASRGAPREATRSPAPGPAAPGGGAR